MSRSHGVLVHLASAVLLLSCVGRSEPDAAADAAAEVDGSLSSADSGAGEADSGAGEADSGVGDAGLDAGNHDASSEPPQVTTQTYPHVDGSTSTLPMDRLIACELFGLGWKWQAGLGREGEAEIVPVATTPAEQVVADWIMQHIIHNTTHQAYLNLVDGAADLIFVANRPSDEELAYAQAHGVVFDVRPIALDALVMLVNAQNPVAELTTAEIRAIFMAQLTTWDQVGGSPDPIHPYVRPPNSGSQELFDSIVMDGLQIPEWPPDRTVAWMGMLIDKITADPLSIGYSVYYYVTYQYPNYGFKVLACDGVIPGPPSIGTRTYPFTAEVWAVTRADLASDSLAYQLRDWLLTPSGQGTVGRSGYVPIQP